MRLNYFIFLISFIPIHTFCQNKSFDSSLKDATFKYFNDKLDEDHERPVLLKISQAYLDKAKREKQARHVFNAYKAMVHHSDEKLKLTYADSMYYSAIKIKDTMLIASSYLTKGIIYYNFMEYSKSLDNLLRADRLIPPGKNEYLAHKVKFNIANVKMTLGFYNDAIILFKDCVLYFGREGDTPFVSPVAGLGLCYCKMEQYEQSSKTNNLGLSLAKEEQNVHLIPYFIKTEGINEFYRENYNSSIRKLNWALPQIINNRDLANEVAIYYYLGRDYLKLQKNEIAISYFEKIDKAFDERNYVSPEFRQAYEILIKYWKSKQNLEKQLYYIQRLQTADSVTHKRFKYLSSKILTEYDAKELNYQSNQLQGSIHSHFLISLLHTVGAVTVLLACAFLIVQRQIFRLVDKKRNDHESNKQQGDKIELNPEITATILKKIEKFEEKKKFLEKELTLVKFSSQIESNTKYVSKIINQHKGKSFTEYINDLRIDYLVGLLQNEKKYRNYNYTALAHEVGFCTVQSFTRAFVNRMGVSVSEFLEGLGK